MIINKPYTKLAVIIAAACFANLSVAEEKKQEAQKTDNVKQEQKENTVGIEVISITARKRNESLQEVPEAVTVLGGALIENAGIDSMQAVADIAPNFHMNDSFSKATIRLNVRGVGTPQGGEAPVSFVLDGATVADISFINQGLFDVQSIQLLRGPQGSLYGQGAIAGAVIITSAPPSDEFSGNLKLQTESGNDNTLSGALSGPIVEDSLYYRLGFTYNNRDGQIDNVENESVDFVDDAINARLTLNWYATDDVSVTYIGKIAQGDYGYGIQYGIQNINDEDENGVNAAVDEIANEATYKFANSNFPGLEIQDVYEHTVKVDWDTGFADFTSITNVSSIEDTFWGEWDAGPSATSTQAIYNQTEGFSQEFRISSYDADEINWIVGASYRNRDNLYQVALPGDDGKDFYQARSDWDLRDEADTNSKDFGLYAFASYDVTDELEVTAALRYDKSEREQTYSYVTSGYTTGYTIGSDHQSDDVINNGDGDVGHRKVDFSQLQPKFGLSYTINEDDLVYFSYGKGFRAGGLNHPNYNIQPGEYDAEVSDSYEFGAKTGWLDGRLLVNTAVFYMEMENYQFTEFSGTTGNANLNDVPIQGIEVEIMARPIESLLISIGYGYVDTEIKQFGAELGPLDGNDVPFVPAYTFNANATHTLELSGNAELVSFISYRKSGETEHRSDNALGIDSQDYLDAKVTFKMDNWSVAAYANNVLDYRSAIHFFGGFPGSGFTARVTPNSPRSYGVSVGYKF